MYSNPDLFGLFGDPSKSRARRSGMEIVCDVLQVLSEGSLKPTHILYRANISWNVLNSSLDFLVKKGIVKKELDGKRTVYALTEEGRRTLELYDALRMVLAGRNENSKGEALARAANKSPSPLEAKAVAGQPRDKVHYTF